MSTGSKTDLSPVISCAELGIPSDEFPLPFTCTRNEVIGKDI